MRWLLIAFCFLGFAVTLHAETFLYVSMAPEKKIGVYKLDAKDGSLALVEAFSVEGSPGSLCVAPDHRFLFASLRTIDSLASYRIDAKTGKLTHINTIRRGVIDGDKVHSLGNAAYVRFDPVNYALYTASYMGGNWSNYRVGNDGTLRAKEGGWRSSAKTAHAIVFDPTYQWLFVPHVEPNAIFQYRREDNKNFEEADPAKVVGQVNAGARHLAFHPTLPMAYSSDETGSSITAYAFDIKKGLSLIQTLSTLPADFKGKNTTAEVKVHPNGKFVWVSNRGHDSLAGFRIDAKTGELTALGQTPTEKTPRSFEIDPDGRYVFGAGEGTGKLAVYRVDAEKGALTRIHTVDVGKSLTWVMAVKMAK